jgi:hypothetical protein
MSLPLVVAILFLLDFMKQTQTIRFEKSPQLADAHGQNSSGGSGSGGHHCYARDACWTHISVIV